MISDENRAAHSKANQFKEKFQEFKLESYSGLDNNRLAAYAVFSLEENGITASQENLIITLFLMFPSKFSLVGFPEHPDAERVNRSLLQLGPKYRGWATGDRHIGYTLTDKGRLVVAQTKKLMIEPEPTKRRRGSPKERTRDPNSEVKEIELTKLWQQFNSGTLGEPDEFAIWELLRAFPSSSKKSLRNRIRNMQVAAKLVGREDVLKFIGMVEEKYKHIFNDE